MSSLVVSKLYMNGRPERDSKKNSLSTDGGNGVRVSGSIVDPIKVNGIVLLFRVKKSLLYRANKRLTP